MSANDKKENKENKESKMLVSMKEMDEYEKKLYELVELQKKKNPKKWEIAQSIGQDLMDTVEKGDVFKINTSSKELDFVNKLISDIKKGELTASDLSDDEKKLLIKYNKQI